MKSWIIPMVTICPIWLPKCPIQNLLIFIIFNTLSLFFHRGGSSCAWKQDCGRSSNTGPRWRYWMMEEDPCGRVERWSLLSFYSIVLTSLWNYSFLHCKFNLFVDNWLKKLKNLWRKIDSFFNQLIVNKNEEIYSLYSIKNILNTNP